MMNKPQIWADDQAARTIHVIQGSFEATANRQDVMTTILGSCVCTCLCDPVAEVGGMNHFLLPDGTANASGPLRYGLHAMELLINALLHLGAERHRLQAKLFGGASLHDGLGGIGSSNAAFAQKFLETEGIACVGQSLGGTRARRVRFVPTTGRAQQLFLEADAMPMPPRPERARAPDPGDGVTFF